MGHGVGNLPPIFSLSLLSLCIQFPCSGCLSVMRCSLSIGLSLSPSLLPWWQLWHWRHWRCYLPLLLVSAEDRCGGGRGGGAGHPSLPPDLSLEQHHPRWPTSSSSSPISWSPPAGQQFQRDRPCSAGCRQIQREGGRGRRLDIVVAAAVAAVAAASVVAPLSTKVVKLVTQPDKLWSS